MGTATSAAGLSRQLPSLHEPNVDLVVPLRVIAALATASAVLTSVSVAGPSPALIAALGLGVGATPLARLVEGDERRRLPWLMVIATNVAVLFASFVYA